MQELAPLKTVAKCIPIKAGTRQSLAEQIEKVLNGLSEETKLTAKIEVSTIATTGDNFVHFAYIIYFEKNLDKV
jgi:hypothetical protein